MMKKVSLLEPHRRPERPPRVQDELACRRVADGSYKTMDAERRAEMVSPVQKAEIKEVEVECCDERKSRWSEME